MATFHCDSCGHSQNVPDRLAGRRTKCPQCGTVGQVSAPDAPAAPEVPAAPEAPAAPAQAVFQCASCGYTRPTPAALLGRTVKCPSCDQPGRILASALKPVDLEMESITLDDLAGETPPPPPPPPRNANTPETRLTPDAAPQAPAARTLFQGNVLKNVFSGLVSGTLGACFSLALTCLIFPQPELAAFYPQALALTLVSAVVMGAVYALTSRVPFAIAGPESMACVLLALLVESVRTAMPGSAPGAVFVTSAASMALVAALGGALVYLLGRLRLAALVRFVPIQITGGVLAAVGVFLMTGAYAFVSGRPFSAATLAASLTLEGMTRFVAEAPGLAWVPALGFGLILFVLLSRVRNSLFLILLMGLGLALGLSERWLPGSELARLAGLAGFLPAGAITASPLLDLNLVRTVNWNVVLDQAPFLAAMVALLVMTDMSRITSLEVVMGRELDVDREFRFLGLGNLITGLAGGLPGAVSLGRTLGGRAAGAAGPLSGIVAALVCLAAMLHLGPWLPLVARFLPAGFLFYLGLSLVKDWLVDTRSVFTRKDDYALLLLTFTVTVVLGLLLGMAVGLVLAMLVTVSRFSSSSAVGRALSGESHRSNVDRAPEQLKLLRAKGSRILIVRLRGFLFLGSIHGVLRRINERLARQDAEPLRYVVLDFGGVSGMGSSVNVGFIMLMRLARDKEFQLVLTSLSLEVSEHLERVGFVRSGEESDTVQVLMNTDFALEWCENRILEEEGALGGPDKSLAELLAPVFPDPAAVPRLLAVLTRLEVRKGEYVFRQGDAPDAMYFVESGTVNIELEMQGGRILRLKKLGPGTVFGEMGLYTTAPRSASVVATQKCVLHRLSAGHFQALQAKAPRVASAVHRFVVTLLADHLAEANVKLRDLSREA